MRPHLQELRALTRAARQGNYDVICNGVNRGTFPRDVAIGYARGLMDAGLLYGGGQNDAIVQVLGVTVWPEERWGEGLAYAGPEEPTGEGSEELAKSRQRAEEERDAALQKDLKAACNQRDRALKLFDAYLTAVHPDASHVLRARDDLEDEILEFDARRAVSPGSEELEEEERDAALQKVASAPAVWESYESAIERAERASLRVST